MSFLREKSFWNISFSFLVFPYYLYNIKLLKINFFGLDNLVWIIFFGGFFGFIFFKNIRLYQFPVSFLISSALFIQVTAGRTIPSWIVIIILSISMFIIQELITYQEFNKYEFSKEIMMANIILSNFLLYSYIFGTPFISGFNVIQLTLILFLYNFNIFNFFFYIYGINKNWVISVFFSYLSIQWLLFLRLLPYSHLNLSIILNIFVIFSIITYKDVFMKKISHSEVIIRAVIVLVLIIILIFTANKTVI